MLDQVIQSIKQEQVKNQPQEKPVVDFSMDFITDKMDIPDVIPVVTIRDAVFVSKCDVSIIGGLPKAGKSSVCAFIIATALKQFGSDADTLSIRSAFCEGKPVVYIDTEQSRANTLKFVKVIKKLVGIVDQPDNLKIFNLKKYDVKTKCSKIFAMMDAFPDTHLWIIDGVADLIYDPNDTKESFQILEDFLIKSEVLNTSIILSIHENPGSSKLRGNLGSQAERKCGGAITIKKDKQKRVHIIEPRMFRASGDFEPVLFEYSKEKGHVVSVDEALATEIRRSMDKGQIKFEKRLQLAKRALVTGSLRYGDLVESIKSIAQEIELKPISRRTAENRISELVELKILSMNGDFYALADKYIPQP